MYHKIIFKVLHVGINNISNVWGEFSSLHFLNATFKLYTCAGFFYQLDLNNLVIKS